MHTPKQIPLLLLAAGLAVFCTLVHAQSADPTTALTSKVRTGPVDMTWHKGVASAGSQVRVSGDVHLSSDIFAAQAEVITLDLATNKKGAGPGGIQKATMEPLPGKQVSGHYQDIAQGRSYQFQADHAVYVPDTTRPGGGRIDLTGHVRLDVNAPVALDGPLVTVTEHATVLLGQGTDYPKVETNAGHLTFTPLNGGQ